MAAGLQSRWILVEDLKSHKPGAVHWEGGVDSSPIAYETSPSSYNQNIIIEFKQKLFSQVLYFFYK